MLIFSRCPESRREGLGLDVKRNNGIRLVIWNKTFPSAEPDTPKNQLIKVALQNIYLEEATRGVL